MNFYQKWGRQDSNPDQPVTSKILEPVTLPLCYAPTLSKRSSALYKSYQRLYKQKLKLHRMSKKELLFPHQQIRPVQDQLINQVQESLEKKQHCLVHAPTGIGKTAGILAPVLTFAAQKDLTIFFLTPRHTQHKIVINTIKQIQDKHNIKIPTVDLIGKKWMCPVPGTDLLTSQEFSEYCQDVIKKDTCNYYSSFKAKDKKFERNSLYEQLKQINPVPVEKFSE